MEVRRYQTTEGKIPLTEWLDGLRDGQTRARILARLDRLHAGLFGDWKSVRAGVFELRIDHGPGYRVYFGKEGTWLLERLQGAQRPQAARSRRRNTCEAKAK